MRSVQLAEWLALPTLDHEVPNSNPAGSGNQLLTVRCFIAQSLSLSSLHLLDMTKIMLKET